MVSRTTTSRAVPLFLALLAPLGSAGCVEQMATQMPRMTPALVDSSLKELENPRNRQRMVHVLASPDVKILQQELVADLLDGSLAALSEEQRADRVGELTARYTASVMNGFSRELIPQLAPMGAAVVQGAMSDENQQAMQHFIGSMVQASVEPVVRSIDNAEIARSVSTAMTTELGPAIQKILRDNLGPGLAQTLSNPEVKRAMNDAAHDFGREMVLGVNEGLIKVQQNDVARDSSLLGSVSSMAHEGATATKLLPALLSAVVLALVVWVARLLTRTRRYRTAEEQRIETTRVLNEAIRAAEGKPWSGELMTALEDRFRNDEEALLRIHAARNARPWRRQSTSGVHRAS
jgi:hypothetical protein